MKLSHVHLVSFTPRLLWDNHSDSGLTAYDSDSVGVCVSKHVIPSNTV